MKRENKYEENLVDKILIFASISPIFNAITFHSRNYFTTGKAPFLHSESAAPDRTGQLTFFFSEFVADRF